MNPYHNYLLDKIPCEVYKQLSAQVGDEIYAQIFRQINNFFMARIVWTLDSTMRKDTHEPTP